MSKLDLPSRQGTVRYTALDTAHACHNPGFGGAVFELHMPHIGSPQHEG